MAEKVQVHFHPDLIANWDEYNLIGDFEDGRVSRVGNHLWAHPSERDGTPEGQTNYRLRQERLYNINFCRPYLKMHAAHMAQRMDLTGVESDRMKPILADVTGSGLNYLLASRLRRGLYMRDGRVGTLVDSPATIADSKVEARKTGERSYQVIYQATQIRDWDFFKTGPRTGELSLVVVDDGFVKGDDGKVYHAIRRFTQPEGSSSRFTWERLKQTGTGPSSGISTEGIECERVDDGEGGLTYIPFYLMGDGPDESFIADVWPLNLAWMNLNSVLSHIIYNQGFQRSIFTGMEPEDISKLTEWIVGVARNPNVNILTIPPGDPVACEKELDRLKREAHRRARFEYNQLAEDSKESPSAASKAQDQKTRIQIYNDTLDLQIPVEQRIYAAHTELEGKRQTIGVQVSRDFGLEDPEAEELALAAAEASADKLGVVEVQREILKVRLSKIRFIPSKDEDGEDGEDAEAKVRERLYEIVDQADPTASRAGEAFASAGGNLFRGAD